MNIAYLISVIISHNLYNKIADKVNEKLEEEGYVKKNVKHDYLMEIIGQAVVLLLPILNVAVPVYYNKHFDVIYKYTRDNLIKEGKIYKETDEEEKQFDKNNKEELDRLKINGINKAKSIQEKRAREPEIDQIELQQLVRNGDLSFEEFSKRYAALKQEALAREEENSYDQGGHSYQKTIK